MNRTQFTKARVEPVGSDRLGVVLLDSHGSEAACMTKTWPRRSAQLSCMQMLLAALGVKVVNSGVFREAHKSPRTVYFLKDATRA
jgi:hypothetical protein